jgi:hypothetical protein
MGLFKNKNKRKNMYGTWVDIFSTRTPNSHWGPPISKILANSLKKET